MDTSKSIIQSILFILLCFNGVYSASSVNIIPYPQKVVVADGEFAATGNLSFVYSNPELEPSIVAIQQSMQQKFGTESQYYLSPKSEVENAVLLELMPGFAPEGYKLQIQQNRIVCQASTSGGIFYALQSLLQVLDVKNGKLTATCLTIEDAPAYVWRGYMLDEARHFSGKETVKQYLDIMASLKLNRFHWHLTDEQAWRIEIKHYPKLTEIGSTGSWSDRNAPSAFYTQDDIKEIVAYAAQRNIMVIPEIDMPGHATAAARSYPEISGGGEGRWKDFTFHPAKETTYEFIDNILTEIAILFPAPYIHIGGDEVHYGNQSWYTDPQIQKFIKDNELKDEVGLEHYFVRRACKIVNSKGKKMIGWDEIQNAGVTPENAIVMWWRHDKNEMLSQALSKGFDVIMTPRIPYYFDFVQDAGHQIGRR